MVQWNLLNFSSTKAFCFLMSQRLALRHTQTLLVNNVIIFLSGLRPMVPIIYFILSI